MAARRQWPAYGIEAACLGIFMVAAVGITALIDHPSSILRHALPNPLLRRALTGVGMGITAAALIYSRWGQRSGAHLNPSVTLTYLRLGKVSPADAALYVGSQFAGAIAGLAVATLVFGGVVRDPTVNFVATVPGRFGALPAFAGELTISFLLMTVVLGFSNTPGLARFTGIAAACLVAMFITVEAPLSGMSMNPARTFAPALATGTIGSLWIYVAAPLAGMLLAAEAYVRRHGAAAVRCAKMHHPAGGPCHFGCEAAPAAHRFAGLPAHEVSSWPPATT
jgi:aquaporin Z